MRSGTRLLCTAALAITALAPAALAQRNAAIPETSPIVKQIHEEIGRATGEYWTPRLNDYKARIDGFLSADDLETLNRLRVRWGMILDHAKAKLAVKAQGKGANGSDARIEFKVDDESSAKLSETFEIFTAAKEIASRYRGDLDRVTTTAIGDLAGYLGALAEHGDRFAARNGAEIAGDPEAKKLIQGSGKLREAAGKLRSEKSQKEIAMVSAFAIEPIILLYNGADLGSLLAATPIKSPISGLTLPEMSALKQNFPNPASTSTTIVYLLDQPSSSAVIRIFDARGELVATYDQGARATGEHQAEIDVSRLASGSYLYHLTVQTEKGPRVYSRTMQVVR